MKSIIFKPEEELHFLRRDNRNINFTFSGGSAEESSELTSYFNCSVLCDMIGEISYETSETIWGEE